LPAHGSAPATFLVAWAQKVRNSGNSGRQLRRYAGRAGDLLDARSPRPGTRLVSLDQRRVRARRRRSSAGDQTGRPTRRQLTIIKDWLRPAPILAAASGIPAHQSARPA
jgi:hypothetical protein